MSPEESFPAWVHSLFGGGSPQDAYSLIFGARLDEAGNDQNHDVVVAGGVIAEDHAWATITHLWAQANATRGVNAFHMKDLNARERDFAGWSDAKASRYLAALRKFVEKRVFFSMVVGVDRAVHREVKEQLRGTKGFKADSDFGLCFRLYQFWACHTLARHDPRHRIRFLLETGPFSADADVIYQQIAADVAKPWAEGMHIPMLGGFAHVPKGDNRSLEIADYISGRSADDALRRGGLVKGARRERYKKHMAYFMDRGFLLDWYQRIIERKEARKAHWDRILKKLASSQV